MMLCNWTDRFFIVGILIAHLRYFFGNKQNMGEQKLLIPSLFARPDMTIHCKHFLIIMLSQVMELLVHINKRVKSRPKIQLPVRALMAQYQDPEASPFVTVSELIEIHNDGFD